MTKDGTSKSFKDQNRLQLWLVIAANAVIFFVAVQSDMMVTMGWKALLTAATNLLPLGLAFVVTSLANGLLSADMKARLVFLRWKHALPGHRAFSEHALADSRIDFDRLKKSLGNKLPEGPEAENRTWYRFLKEVESAPNVTHTYREFLLMRDYAGFSALFLVGLGVAALFLVRPWRVTAIYCAFLLLQFIVVRYVAATYGIRLVRTVLAVKAAKQPASSPRKPKDPKPV